MNERRGEEAESSSIPARFAALFDVNIGQLLPSCDLYKKNTQQLLGIAKETRDLWVHEEEEGVHSIVKKPAVYPPEMLPTVFFLLENRIREHPEEAVQADEFNELPIHQVFCIGCSPPISLIQALISAFPESLAAQAGLAGRTPLVFCMTWVTRDPFASFQCFQTILNKYEAAAHIPDRFFGRLPLHESMISLVSPLFTWELLRSYPGAASVPYPEIGGVTPLERLEESENKQWPKILSLKMTLYYGCVPELPHTDTNGEIAMDEIAMFFSHPSVEIVAARLQPGDNPFILHAAAAAGCPHILAAALIVLFPQQARVEDPTTGRLPLHIALASGSGGAVGALLLANLEALMVRDPITGLLPFEMAMNNLTQDASIENVDAVYHILRENPALLNEILLQQD